MITKVLNPRHKKSNKKGGKHNMAKKRKKRSARKHKTVKRIKRVIRQKRRASHKRHAKRNKHVATATVRLTNPRRKHSRRRRNPGFKLPKFGVSTSGIMNAVTELGYVTVGFVFVKMVKEQQVNLPLNIQTMIAKIPMNKYVIDIALALGGYAIANMIDKKRSHLVLTGGLLVAASDAITDVQAKMASTKAVTAPAATGASRLVPASALNKLGLAAIQMKGNKDTASEVLKGWKPLV